MDHQILEKLSEHLADLGSWVQRRRGRRWRGHLSTRTPVVGGRGRGGPPELAMPTTREQSGWSISSHLTVLSLLFYLSYVCGCQLGVEEAWEGREKGPLLQEPAPRWGGGGGGTGKILA